MPVAYPVPDGVKPCPSGKRGFPGPESQYLARVVADEPETVLQIILRMPDTTNVRVYEVLAEVALGMPLSLAAELVPKTADA